MRREAWTEPIPLSDVGGAWLFPDRGVVYTETRKVVPVVDDVHVLVDFFLWAASQVPIQGRPTIVHDWRSFQSIPRDVRRAFVQRRRDLSEQPERVIIAVTLNPLVRVALQTVALGAQLLAQAVRLDLVDDPGPALRALSVGAPDPALHARLRLAWRHNRSTSSSVQRTD
jgi:hypothetical protein